MRRWLFLLALLLPLAAMMVSIIVRQSAMAASSEWQIPITGFDPRDPLRGRYVAFQYDWQMAGDPSLCLSRQGCDLCLGRSAGTVRATAVVRGTACPHRVDVAASRLSVRPARRPEGPSVTFSGRIFVSEASAPRLEEQLQAGPADASVRLDSNGRLVPRAIIVLSAPPVPDPPG